MSIGSSLSGLRAGFSDNLVLDAGVAYVNANIASMLSATTSANVAFARAIDPTNTWIDPNGNTVAPRKLGGTREGTTVQINKTERQVDVDGRRFNIKGLQRVDMIDAKVVTSLLEMCDVQTLQLALGSSVTTDHANYDEIRPYLYPIDTDYIGNITIFATVVSRKAPNGEPLPICVVLENCRANNIQEIPLKDKNEAVLKVELTAHALDSDAFKCPLVVIVPKQISQLGYY